MSFDHVCSCFDRDAAEDGLDLLVDLWAASRDPALAALIDVVERQLPCDPVPEGRKHLALWKERWLSGRGPAEVLRTWSVGSRKTSHAKFRLKKQGRPDPRFTTAFALGADLPPDVGMLLDLAKRSGDPRLEAHLDEAGERFDAEDPRHTYVPRMIEEARAALGPAGSAGDLTGIGKAIQSWIERGAKTGGSPPPGGLDSLDEAIAKNPDDDGALAVKADRMIEEGDPLGEFINAQLLDPDRLPRAAPAALVERLLGPLAPVVDFQSARFHRGLLHTAKITLKTAEQRKRLQRCTALRSIRRVYTSAKHLQSPDLRQVTHIGFRLRPHASGSCRIDEERFTHHDHAAHAVKLLTALAKGKGPEALQSVCVALPNEPLQTAHWQALADGAGLGLRTLHLAGTGQKNQRPRMSARLDELAAATSIHSIPRLIIDDLDPYGLIDVPLTALWQRLGREAGRDLVVICGSGWCLHLRKMPDGLHLRLSGHPSAYDPSGGLKRWLPEVCFASVKIDAHVHDASQRQAIEAHLGLGR